MLVKVFYKWKEFDRDVDKIIRHIKQCGWKVDSIYAIPRGGLILGTVLSNLLDVPLILNEKYIRKNTLVVDDLVDGGNTMIRVVNVCNCKTITLHRKVCTKFNPDFYCNECNENEWISYPWENKNGKMVRDGTAK